MTATRPRDHDALLDRALDVARADPRVGAAVLSGSHADPEAAADVWSDDRHVMAHPRRVEDRAAGKGYRS